MTLAKIPAVPTNADKAQQVGASSAISNRKLNTFHDDFAQTPMAQGLFEAYPLQRNESFFLHMTACDEC